MGVMEGAMGELRGSLDRGASPDCLAEKVAVRGGLFDDAEAALAPDAATEASTFLGAFTILLREGLEALLIVVAMIAFLRKAERGEALRYEIGRATSELQSLMRISYAVLFLKKKNNKSLYLCTTLTYCHVDK